LSLAARGTGLTIAPRQKFEACPDRARLRIVRVEDLELRSIVALLHGDALGNLSSLVSWLHGRMTEQLSSYKNIT